MISEAFASPEAFYAYYSTLIPAAPPEAVYDFKPSIPDFLMLGYMQTSYGSVANLNREIFSLAKSSEIWVQLRQALELRDEQEFREMLESEEALGNRQWTGYKPLPKNATAKRTREEDDDEVLSWRESDGVPPGLVRWLQEHTVRAVKWRRIEGKRPKPGRPKVNRGLRSKDGRVFNVVASAIVTLHKRMLNRLPTE